MKIDKILEINWIRNKNHFIESGSHTDFQCYLRHEWTVDDSNDVAIGNETGFCNFSSDGIQNHAHPWNLSFIYKVPWNHYAVLPSTHIQLMSFSSFLFFPFLLQIFVWSAAVFKTYPTDIRLYRVTNLVPHIASFRSISTSWIPSFQPNIKE